MEAVNIRNSELNTINCTYTAMQSVTYSRPATAMHLMNSAGCQEGQDSSEEDQL